jgi:hypothetical protein
MMKNKKIGLLATVLVASLVVGVFAAITLSNTLTTTFNVKKEPLLLEWKVWTPAGDLYRGAWYATWIRLYNPTTSTFANVIVKFTLYAEGYAFPENSVTIQYWDGDSWEPMGIDIASWGTATLTGYFGDPTNGFPVGIGYDETTGLQFRLNEEAPIAGYTFTAWAETVP